MSGFAREHTQEWLDYFARHGYPDAAPLGAGVEGAIYLLGDGTVAVRRGAGSGCRANSPMSCRVTLGDSSASPAATTTRIMPGTAR